MAQKRIERKASQTAGYTCFCRACAAREADPRLRGPDYLAEKIIPFGAWLMAVIPFVRRLVMARMFPAGIYEYVIARTREMDAAFAAALEKGFAQIVLLGAGFARPGRAGPGIPALCASPPATAARGSSSWTSPSRWIRRWTYCGGNAFPSRRI